MGSEDRRSFHGAIPIAINDLTLIKTISDHFYNFFILNSFKFRKLLLYFSFNIMLLCRP